MKLTDSEKSKKLLKLEERKRKIEERKLKIVEQIHIEEDKIRFKLGKMTGAQRKYYQKMKQAYNLRQEGNTFPMIGKNLDISVSQASKLCQRYAILSEALKEKED